MCALPRPECIFRSYCTSRPRGVPKLRNSVLTFGAVEFFLCSAPSVRVTLLTFATPPVWESNFYACSFWMCCWRSGFSPPASFRNSSITRLQIVTINYIWFKQFSCARDFTMQCLCHPSLSTTFFSFATIALVAKWASRARGVETIICDVPAFVPVDIFLLLPPSLPLTIFVFWTPLMKYCLFCLKWHCA